MRTPCIAAALAAALLFGGCAAPRLVNPTNPGADLEADRVACRKDAERVARLDMLAAAPGTAGSCMEGRACAGAAETRRIHLETQAQQAERRCLAAKGWREPG